jgi:23S rRNA (uridine2552-2'-O)-methyltransferase
MTKPYEPKDAYYRRARREHLRARSAFKLEEIQERWKLVRAGDAVIDLGAAPGGFLQILADIVGPKGCVVGVDVAAIRPLGGVVTTIQDDVMADDLIPRLRDLLAPRLAHVVASDLAPKTTGIRDTDEARSIALARRAAEIARALLTPGGHFVAKAFMGPDFDPFCTGLRADFAEVRILRPEATRSRSREAYVIALRRRLS